MAGHTVLHLPSPQHCLAARGRLLRRPTAQGREREGGRGEEGQVRVGGDQQGMELQEEQEEEKELKVSKATLLLS